MPDRKPPPGIPSRWQKPIVEIDARTAGPDEPTRPDLPVNRQTKPGIGPLPQPLPPPPPPRSITPNSIPVTLPDGSKVSRHTLRRIWVYIAPVIATVAFNAWTYGKVYVMAYIAAYQAAKTDIAEIKGSLKTLSEQLAEFRGEESKRLDGVVASVNRDGVLFDDHDKRVLRLEKSIETVSGRLDSLSRTRAIVVKPEH